MKAFSMLCAALLLTTAAFVREVDQPVIKYPDKIAAAAVPFRLDEVRLLNGPFRTR